MIDLHLRQEDARLVFLAIAYHLGRPGSELDPVTKKPAAHGLGEIGQALQPQLRQAVARIRLQAEQVARLQSGMLGSITELKAYPMLEIRPEEQGGGRRSTVAGFDQTLRHLFPEIDEDAENAMAIAERMLVLKRRLDKQLAAAPANAAAGPGGRGKPRWWPFGR